MFDYVAPVLFVLLAWWFSTGAIFYLDGLPRRTYRYSMAGMTGVLAAALCGLSATAGDVSSGGAYIAFACALAVWGWQEMGFLMGFVTGPRRVACPPGVGTAKRFSLAVETILYHELALAVSGFAVVAMTWGGDNQIGAWTFLALWAMRLSTKLNLFLGVPNLSEEVLPADLAYLASYFAKRPMNLFFPVSVTLATTATGFAWGAVSGLPGDAPELAGAVLIATILTLGVLEHWFLVVPLPVNAIWKWGLRSHAANDGEEADAIPMFGLASGRGDLRPHLAPAKAARRMVRPIGELFAPRVDVSIKRRPS
jgi:putative photosynthetic complex assembly protein 2